MATNRKAQVEQVVEAVEVKPEAINDNAVVVDPRSIKLGMEQTLTFTTNRDGNDEEITRTYPSKSLAILDLHAEGLKTGEIAKLIGIRYQFAYNVIKRHQSK